MERNKSTDFKSNVVNLTKIPANEFEKCFQEWMECDDVARSLQAKLRCDLIKNFNKTNLGKHILSHTMTPSGGTTIRLTLSPLILALNTLVAEFLYAQNCHFTLSVFCTEIPFRNTLPDFESMRKFRFNKEEILEIWRAVTGVKGNKEDLNKDIIHNYETNPNMSLLLLIIKYLLKKEPLDQLKRNAEVQTEVQEKSHKLISARCSKQENTSVSKADVKYDSNLYQINKYLLTLSEKVIEMTREFEKFATQKRESRTRNLKSSRSREYYALNKSLERITENMKAMAKSERKNKCLSNIIESVDNLTKQFVKCAHNFNNVIKFLSSKEYVADTANQRKAEVKLKEQQTETENQEKSFNDWMHEMRNTENGQTFLNRVESSLQKALTKHQEELKNETNNKINQLKSLMKLHYQQKLSKQLLVLQEPRVKLEEARKYNDEIKKRLEHFQSKQMELLEKLHESSLELKEAQLQQKLNAKQNVQEELLESRHRDDHFTAKFKVDTLTKEITTQSASKDISNLQHTFLDIGRNIAEERRSIDEIIYDAKLRIQQLESESSQLEQNFQSYLERRKRCQEQDNNTKEKSKMHTFLQDLHEITTDRLRLERRKIDTFDKDEEQVKEELQLLRQNLHQGVEPRNKIEKSAKSDTSTSSLEIKNAILEAKLKFFEHENTLRKCREQEDEIRTVNLLQKHLEKYSELQDYTTSETNVNFEPQFEVKKNLEFNTESSLSEINIKDKTLDEEQDIDLSPMTDQKSQKLDDKVVDNVRRELFPKDSMNQNDDLQAHLRYHEPISLTNRYIKQSVAEEMPIKKAETTSELIKQSMAKMQLLFEQQSQPQEALKEMVNELEQEKVLQKEEPKTIRQITRSSEVLDKSLTTTVTSTATASANTTNTNEETDINPHSKISQNVTSPNRYSTHSLVNLSNGNVDGFEATNAHFARDLQETSVIKEFKKLEITIPNHEDKVIDSSASSQLQLSFKLETNTQAKRNGLDFNSFDNDKEIGEILEESDRKLNEINAKSFENFSSRSSSDLEISVGHQNMDAKNLADDSESDFWA